MITIPSIKEIKKIVRTSTTFFPSTNKKLKIIMKIIKKGCKSNHEINIELYLIIDNQVRKGYKKRIWQKSIQEY